MMFESFIRCFIRYRGYLKLKWWDAMVLEKWSGLQEYRSEKVS